VGPLGGVRRLTYQRCQARFLLGRLSDVYDIAGGKVRGVPFGWWRAEVEANHLQQRNIIGGKGDAAQPPAARSSTADSSASAERSPSGRPMTMTRCAAPRDSRN
jgi:hypothetical protein